jgi:hypothetical protein
MMPAVHWKGGRKTVSLKDVSGLSVLTLAVFDAKFCIRFGIAVFVN